MLLASHSLRVAISHFGLFPIRISGGRNVIIATPSCARLINSTILGRPSCSLPPCSKRWVEEAVRCLFPFLTHRSKVVLEIPKRWHISSIPRSVAVALGAFLQPTCVMRRLLLTWWKSTCTKTDAQSL